MAKGQKDPSLYVAELRKDQWDLIVMALDHVRGMTNSTDASYGIDKLGRQFLRRCIDETTADITSQVPKE